MKTIYQNNEHGNIFFTYRKMMEEAVPIYDFGENAPAVNAEYLLQIMQALGEDIVITAAAERPMVGGLYIYTNIGDAILMPSRK